MPDGSNLILGSESNAAWKANNTSDATTKVERNGPGAVPAFVIENLNGVAIQAQANGAVGVAGTSPSNPGVAGTSTSGPGVRGRSSSAPGVLGISIGDAGVSGRSAGLGVRGQSDRIGVEGLGSIGVHGDAGFIGVLGEARSGTGVYGNGRVGVFGVSVAAEGVSGNSSTGTGVKGESTVIGVSGVAFGSDPFAAGVLGVSRLNRIGVRGRSNQATVQQVGFAWGITGAGVLAESPTGAGILAKTGARTTGGLSGAFVGDVAIDGTVFIIGSVLATGGKAAVVPHPDGSQRMTFALECPESFFEDFGRARVVRGRARVAIDRDFAALVDRNDYYVFLTPEGDSAGLFVSRKRRDSFEVREQQGGKSALGFSYRLVARRKDVPRRRLPKVAMPRAISFEDVPLPETVMNIPRARKAPRPPQPLKELDRIVAAKRRKVTRGRPSRRKAKNPRRR
jgi:hypothetical protein